MSTIHKAAVSQRHCCKFSQTNDTVTWGMDGFAPLLHHLHESADNARGGSRSWRCGFWMIRHLDRHRHRHRHTHRSDDPICLLQVQFVFEPINHRSMYVFTYFLTMCYYDTTIINFKFQISFYSAPCFKLIFVLSCPTSCEPPLDYFWCSRLCDYFDARLKMCLDCLYSANESGFE